MYTIQYLKTNTGEPYHAKKKRFMSRESASRNKATTPVIIKQNVQCKHETLLKNVPKGCLHNVRAIIKYIASLIWYIKCKDNLIFWAIH